MAPAVEDTKKTNTASNKVKRSLVVIKKRPIHNKLASARRRQKTNVVPATTRSRGLPASKPVVAETAAIADTARNNISANVNDVTDPLDDDNDDDDDALFANMACDTLLVMQSLQQSRETSLEVPLLCCDGTFVSCQTGPLVLVRGVLECGLHERIMIKGGSSQIVSRELDQLLRTNVLRQLSSATVPGK